MKPAISFLLLAALAAAPAAAQPKADAPTAQAETVHLYLKCDGRAASSGANGGGVAVDEEGVHRTAKPRMGIPLDKSGLSAPVENAGASIAISEQGVHRSACPAPVGQATRP